MDYSVCTSFSPQGYRIYGKRFIETFLEFWPRDVALMVVYEHEHPDIKDPRVCYRDLFNDSPWMEFRQRWKGHPQVDSADHTYGAMKFSRKIFALNGEQFQSRWLLWLDADVETTSPVTDDFLDIVAPIGHDFAVSYLNREFWRFSECGFVGYNMDVPFGRRLLADVQRMYTSGEFKKLAEYGDSYVFDHCRRQLFGNDNDLLLKLVDESHVKDIHVWPRTVLSSCMTHHKGPARKRSRYGGAV